MSKTFKEFAEACWDSHKQVGTKISSRTGKRVPNCVPKNEDNLEEKKVRITKNGKELLVWDAELRTYQQMGWKLVTKDSNGHYINELGPAAMKRLARKRAYAAKTMAKYGQAAKMGIPASKVNQRKNTPTRTKVMNKFITVILCAMMLSSCALLNKLTGNTEVAVPTPTEDIRG